MHFLERLEPDIKALELEIDPAVLSFSGEIFAFYNFSSEIHSFHRGDRSLNKLITIHLRRKF